MKVEFSPQTFEKYWN